jgi:hypothetical protein
MYSVENLKLYIEMAHGKQASDKLFNEISWLIVHSLKEHSRHLFFSIRRPDTVCTDFPENIANFRNLVVSLRRLQSKLPNPTNNGRTGHFYEFQRGNIVRLR